jgi:hypothetical protein
MRVKFVKSLGDIPFFEKFPVAKPQHLGKIARVIGTGGQKTLMMILPCGHQACIDGWKITDIDTDDPNAAPSILCMGGGSSNNPIQTKCWHGYLRKGFLIE